MINFNDRSCHVRHELLPQFGSKRYRGRLWWQLKSKIELFHNVLLARDPARCREDSRDYSSVSKPSSETSLIKAASALSAGSSTRHVRE